MDRLKVGFIHTTPATISMVETGMVKYLPGVEYLHIYDSRVKVDNFASPIGTTPKCNLLRYAEFGSKLEQAGCGVIVSCCSLMPRATAYAKIVINVPFIQLDSVILDMVAANYLQIGVIKTTEYVVPYVTEELETRATKLKKNINLIFSGDSEALTLFNNGDYESHDKIVINEMRKFEKIGVDCILMSQIPFALMENKIHALPWSIPVLYAGEPAYKHISRLLTRGNEI